MKKNRPDFENFLSESAKAPQTSKHAWIFALTIGVIFFCIGSFIATQYLAGLLDYQPALGDPLFALSNFAIYQPFSWILWINEWPDIQEADATTIYAIYILMTLGSLLSIILSGYICSKRRKYSGSPEISYLHGSAHWASLDEIQQMSLLSNQNGVYVGAYWNKKTKTTHYLRHDGPEHIIAFAPTRSGKGVGLVIPTLLSWLDSVLILDIKGENWALTAGWRKMHANNIVLKFDPTASDGSSVCFNPLEEVRLETDKEISDIQNIVTMIVDPEGTGLQDHWTKMAYALLVGVIVHVLYAARDKTLSGVAQFLSDPGRTFEQTLEYMLNSAHDPLNQKGWRDLSGMETSAHPVVVSTARDMMNKATEERSGILSTALSFLTLYKDPTVARNTAKSEFKIHDLMNAEKPVSLYLVIPPSDKDRLNPLIRLMINQILRGLTQKMVFEEGRSVAGYKHRLLLMIDEFPSLGKLDIFQESLAFIAGYGIKAYLIVQDISQLWAVYTKDESIFSNCHIRVAYAPNKIETAEILSKMAGTATIVKDSRSYSGKRGLWKLNQVSVSTQEHSRALLTPDEVMRLPGAQKDAFGNITAAGDMLIFVAGHSPVYGRQILYFIDSVFMERAKIAAPDVSDRL